MLENLASKAWLLDLIGSKTGFLRWLLNRIQVKEARLSQNSQYAAEILTIFLQASKPNRKKLTAIEGIDTFLQLLSSYRKRDPAKGTEEEEYVENIFDSITCCVDEVEGKARFLEAEGIELCLLMIKAGNMSKDRAIRLLDHALEGPSGQQCCEHFVEAAGLKPLFRTLMKKVSWIAYPCVSVLLALEVA